MPHLSRDVHADDGEDLFPSSGQHQVPAASELKNLLRLHGDRLLPILSALREQPWKELITSRDVMDSLSVQGLDLSERTLRLYLAELADYALIERHGRRGYQLTAAGSEVARELTVSRRLGSIHGKMEETMCQLSFDLEAGVGLV